MINSPSNVTPEYVPFESIISIETEQHEGLQRAKLTLQQNVKFNIISH